MYNIDMLLYRVFRKVFLKNIRWDSFALLRRTFLYRVISLWTCGTVNEILVDNVLHFQKCLLEKVR